MRLCRTRNFQPILMGVIQGFILRPLLCSFFINLLEVISDHLYADDVPIYDSGDLSNAAGVIEKLNSDMDNILHWSQLNSPCLNPQKFQAIIFNAKLFPYFKISSDPS
jgi:hypothetical protein